MIWSLVAAPYRPACCNSMDKDGTHFMVMTTSQEEMVAGPDGCLLQSFLEGLRVRYVYGTASPRGKRAALSSESDILIRHLRQQDFHTHISRLSPHLFEVEE
jgi:hypothetical protein